jgi:hypothetical protein
MRLVFLSSLILIIALAGFVVHAQPSPSVTLPPDGGSQQPPVSNASEYLANLYKYFLAFVGIAALFGLVWGGVLYMYSGTNITNTGQAKTWIQNAFYGILLAAAAYLLLWTINPDLINHGFDLKRVLQNAGFNTKIPILYDKAAHPNTAPNPPEDGRSDIPLG